MNSQGIVDAARHKFQDSVKPHAGAGEFRIVLYSHDTMGIGHMRRNTLIARKLKQRFPNASILVIAGSREATVFSQSCGVDCLTLPSFQKSREGHYRSRFLEIPATSVLDIRRDTILAAIRSFQPALLIVDKVPHGAGGELFDSLDWLAGQGNCKVVLGLREILDEPEVVKSDWCQLSVFDTIRSYFDEIWIYGDQRVFDATREYDFPEDILEKARFTGYLNTCCRLETSCLDDQPPTGGRESYLLCTVGGGQDGESLARVFVESAKYLERSSVLLTGPHMPATARAEFREIAKKLPHLEVVEFADEGDSLIRDAEFVVSMGGYNTVASILSWKKRSVVVPRVSPRIEQLIRASRFADLGLIEMIHPDELTPMRLAGAIQNRENGSRGPAEDIDFGGLERICQLVSSSCPVFDSPLGAGK